MIKLIESITSGVPTSLVEVITLGPTSKKPANDVLAYFDRPWYVQRADRGDQRKARTPPWLRARVPEPTNYIAKSLLETGGLRPQLHPRRS